MTFIDDEKILRNLKKGTNFFKKINGSIKD